MKLTFDEAASGPFDLCGNEDTCARVAGPCYTRPGLDAEHVPARDIRCTCSGERRRVIFKVTVDDFISELAFGLPGADAAVQRFDI